jgi:hypothetical protein
MTEDVTGYFQCILSIATGAAYRYSFGRVFIYKLKKNEK